MSNQSWNITLPPHGTGNETYFAQSNEQSYFVKLGAHTDRYQVMSNLGLSPQIITLGYLEDGTSILVQQRIAGKKPSRKEFHLHLIKFAESIKRTHQCEYLKRILPKRSSTLYKDVGLEILGEIEQRWEKRESEVPAFAEYVNEKLTYLKNQIDQFTGEGLVASHNDICNGNWLVSSDEKLYLLDYESMALDDPALDLGAILWWYYPPELRDEFLEIAGYDNDEGFRNRMRIRMAIHNLNIIIPREKSFDRFTPETFDEALIDFRAIVDGRENPQGYYD
ncbi:MAG TPA: aminoglycoside phosphotransferase family protein [Anaerolineales bacterium]|nr:aminoglycoside phosphotransferase family protein [Anaerolineales bacterium]